MHRFVAILDPADVLVDVAAVDRRGVFEQAARLYESRHRVPATLVTDRLFARERLASTGLGHGVAIPHGRIDGLMRPIGVVLRLRQPIPFDSPDQLPVALFVFLFVPEAATEGHLEILSEIAEMLSDRALRDRLLSAVDAPTLHRALAAWKA